MRPAHGGVLAVAIALLWCAAAGVSPCAARDYADGFDEDRTSWKIDVDKSATRTVTHRRTSTPKHSGDAAEFVEFEVRAAVSTVRVEHELPPARLIEELTLSLWVLANQERATLSVRVVFPHQTDPRTSEPLVAVLDGDSVTKANQWQKLECRDLSKKLRQTLPLLRKQLQSETGLRPELDLRGAYIDAAIVSLPTSRGVAGLVLDELVFGPVVDAVAEIRAVQAESDDPEPTRDAEFRLDRLFVGGQPYFPRLLAYHGESLNDLSKLKLNTIWISDYRDTALLQDLKRQGLHAVAIPPRVGVVGKETLDEASIHLAPFGPDTAPILFWNLGTRIPSDAKPELTVWLEQIRNADRRFQRPVMGDVAGGERAFSRQLSMLGVSRAAMHTSFSPKQYREWLVERRNVAQPGSFLWTWIQTEAIPSVTQQRSAAGLSPLVVEPEQLRQQVYAALAAGYRGIGFWTHSALDDERPGALERKLMIAQLNMELTLLEPWLATGNVQSQTPFTVKLSAARNINQRELGYGTGKNAATRQELESKFNEREIQLRRQDQLSRELEAAIMRTDYGLIVLPVWYGEESQYVPGQLAANDAKIIVPGVGESARAWEISTTEIQSLESERVTGGRQVTLRKFDMTTVILLTEDETLVERLRNRMKNVREASAQVSVELARAKLSRTREVDSRMQGLGVGQKDAARILKLTQDLVDRAESARTAGRFHDARLHAADALQMLRILQHAYWSDAVRRLRSPVSSPHTLCFQTLPDHWDMISRFGRARSGEKRNLLRSGDFEDYDTMIAEGWRHEQADVPGINAAAELYPRPHRGTYCLRLIAAPTSGQDAPPVVSERPVSLTTPSVTVHKGQLVYVSGWIKMAAPSLGNLDGAMIYDNLAGPTAALRWRNPSDWQQFEFVREVYESGDIALTIALNGLGEIHLDDLQIIPLETEAASASAPSKPSEAPASRSRALDLLKRFPRLGSKPDVE